jgi:hypothetical protein
MVRRVEPGRFRVHVGGLSPDVPKAINADRKAKVGFYDPLDGVSGEFVESKGYSAHFVYSLETPEKTENGKPFPAVVTVKNDGNLTDVTEARLYEGVALDAWRFELKPGEEKSHAFKTAVYKSGEMAVVAGAQIVMKPIAVVASAARVEFQDIRVNVDGHADLQLTAEARNVGSYPYDGALSLKVDGQPAIEPQSLKLQSGEKRKVALNYLFAVGGLHHVQLNDLPEQLVVVPGGISLALHNPLIVLRLDEGKGSLTKNEISGKSLPVRGTPQWVIGKESGGIQPSSNMSIDAGSAELYRKSFTLSAWVKIDTFGEGGDLALFGGRAPMGADQDNTGTVLNAGIHNKKLFLGFQGRDVAGNKEIPTGSWVNLTYTYDAALRKSALYLDGILDKAANQEPYAGPLDTVGDSSTLQHGRYAMDDVVVAQSCFPPELVGMLVRNGFDSLRQGEYTSEWRPYTGPVRDLETTAEIPEGSKLAVTIETGDKAGNVMSSVTVDLTAGHQAFPVMAVKAGEQVRIRAQVVGTRNGQSPVLRAVRFSGANGPEQWSFTKDWNAGSAGNSIVINDATP